MSEISPKADISPKAKIGNNCKIFPFVYIEDDVVIGDNCIIFPFVSICDGARIGKGNKIHQGSVTASPVSATTTSCWRAHTSATTPSSATTAS